MARRNKYEHTRFTTESIYPVEEGEIVVRLDENDAPKRAGFLCPCGCGHFLGVNLRVGSRNPIWGFERDGDLVTFSPSVQVLSGCMSHFFIKRNEVQWC